MKIKAALLGLVVACFAPVAHAGIYIEPYVSYAMGSQKVDFDDPQQGTADMKGDLKGTAMGGKLGFSFLLVSAGIDYMIINTNAKTDTSEFTTKGSAPGAFVSVGLPLIRISASYFPSITLRNQEDLVYTDQKGSAFKVGVGYKIFPFISLNLDYYSFSSSSASYASNNGVQSGDFATWKSTNSLTMLGLSVPF